MGTARKCFSNQARHRRPSGGARPQEAPAAGNVRDRARRPARRCAGAEGITAGCPCWRSQVKPPLSLSSLSPDSQVLKLPHLPISIYIQGKTTTWSIRSSLKGQNIIAAIRGDQQGFHRGCVYVGSVLQQGESVSSRTTLYIHQDNCETVDD